MLEENIIEPLEQSKKYTIQTLTGLVEANAQVQADIKQKAEDIVQDYFAWWKPIQVVKLAAGEKGDAGLLHPAVRVRANTQKIYIPWVSHKYESFKRINPKWSREIPLSKAGYSDAKLRASCLDWEVEKVLETEAQLKPLRDLLEALHEHKVKYLKLIKSLSTKKEKA
jgi:hypothetical protein